jgi:peptide/nickel transport system permease protein
MARFFLKRLATQIPILLVASVLIFFMVRLTAADPIISLVGTKKLSEASREALIREFHLDKSLPEQYLIWIGGMVRGQFPMSFKYRQPVNEMLANRLPTTLQLVAMSFTISVILSICVGVLCAVKKNTIVDKLLSGLMVLCASSPSFLLAIVLMLIFSLKLNLFPTFGSGHGFVENLYYLALPSISLGVGMFALMGRITRSHMIGQLQADYARTERAKGTPFRKIVFNHCLKSALSPVITIGGMQLAGMVVGAMMVESVFALGGVGGLLVDAIKTADYPVVQTIVILMIALFHLMNLFVDMIYTVLDPRIRAQAG